MKEEVKNDLASEIRSLRIKMTALKKMVEADHDPVQITRVRQAFKSFLILRWNWTSSA